MITSHQFADAVGRKNLAKAVGVGAPAVSNAVERGVFPASWYEVGRALAIEADVDCPPELFGQKSLHTSQFVNDATSFQGVAE
jgi:hypothetical protein